MRPIKGKPQGGIVSPYTGKYIFTFVQDLWVEKVVQPKF